MRPPLIWKRTFTSETIFKDHWFACKRPIMNFTVSISKGLAWTKPLKSCTGLTSFNRKTHFMVRSISCFNPKKNWNSNNQSSTPVYSTPYNTSNPFNLLGSERNLILYIFPKQTRDVGSIPIRRPPVATPQTEVWKYRCTIRVAICRDTLTQYVAILFDEFIVWLTGRTGDANKVKLDQAIHIPL